MAQMSQFYSTKRPIIRPDVFDLRNPLFLGTNTRVDGPWSPENGWLESLSPEPLQSAQFWRLENDLAMWEQLEKRRQDFEERLSVRAENVQVQLAQRDEELQTQRDQERGRNTKLITRVTLVGLLLALAQVLTLTKESVLWKIVAGGYHWLAGH